MPSAEYVKLHTYFSDKPMGKFLSYKQIENDTEIVMDTDGKDLMRRVLYKMEIEYHCYKGDGIELIGGKNATIIVNNKWSRAARAADRGFRACNIASRIEHLMPESDRAQLSVRRGMLGTVKTMYDSLRSPKSGRHESGVSSVPIKPKFE